MAPEWLYSRRAALTAAYHAGIAGPAVGTVAFGWVRTAAGGPVHVLTVGDALVGSADAEAGEVAENGIRSVGTFAGGFLDALFTEVTNLGSAPKSGEPEPGSRNPFELAAEETTKRIQAEQEERSNAEWRQRSKESYGE